MINEIQTLSTSLSYAPAQKKGLFDLIPGYPMRLISIEGAVVARAEVVTRRHTQNEPSERASRRRKVLKFFFSLSSCDTFRSFIRLFCGVNDATRHFGEGMKADESSNHMLNYKRRE
jgi:hypothetical protein